MEDLSNSKQTRLSRQITSQQFDFKQMNCKQIDSNQINSKILKLHSKAINNKKIKQSSIKPEDSDCGKANLVSGTEMAGGPSTETSGELSAEINDEKSTELIDEPVTEMIGKLSSKINDEPPTEINDELSTKLNNEPLDEIKDEPLDVNINIEPIVIHQSNIRNNIIPWDYNVNHRLFEQPLTTLNFNENFQPEENNSSGLNPQESLDFSKKASQKENSYSIYTRFEIYLFVCLVAYAAFFSSVSTPIYLPALPTLEKYFHVSVEKMNLTVTMYSIFQGIGPTLWGPLSDILGRRPIYIICLLIYIIANIGLALAKSYWMLFGFRCLQAAGGASTVSIGAGVIGDLTTREIRGKYMGIFAGLGLIGNAFGPLIGGGLISGLSWRSVFWFLVIGSALLLLIIFIFLPETCRNSVEDGSVFPRNFTQWSLYSFLRSKKKDQPSIRKPTVIFWKQITAKNLAYSFVLLSYKDVNLILIPTSMFYTAWFMVLTAQSNLLSDEYGFNSTQLGCSYLASGIGGLVGSLLSGRLMTHFYEKNIEKFKVQCASRGLPVDMKQFDVKRARLEPTPVIVFVVLCMFIIFGWTIQFKVHYVVPILSTFFLSLFCVFIINTCQTLLIDLFTEHSAAASAVFNLTRCLLCAAGLAAVDSLISELGAGGAYSLLAGLCLLSYGCIIWMVFIPDEKKNF